MLLCEYHFNFTELANVYLAIFYLSESKDAQEVIFQTKIGLLVIPRDDKLLAI